MPGFGTGVESQGSSYLCPATENWVHQSRWPPALPTAFHVDGPIAPHRKRDRVRAADVLTPLPYQLPVFQAELVQVPVLLGLEECHEVDLRIHPKAEATKPRSSCPP